MLHPGEYILLVMLVLFWFLQSNDSARTNSKLGSVLQICSHDVFTHASTEALTYMLFLVTGSGAAILYLNLMQMTLWTLWYVVSIFQTYSLSINNCHDAFKDLVETTLLWVLRLLHYLCCIFILCRTNLLKFLLCMK